MMMNARRTASRLALACLVLSSLASAQRVNTQKFNRAKPGQGEQGRRRVELSSPRDGPVERAWTGGWKQSPFPVCPWGTYATEDLSPDGCEPCPRGTYASSDNLGAVDECSLCPPGRYNDRPGAKTEEGCARCPPHTFGAAPGLTTSACTARCPLGKYASTSGNMFEADCKDCPLGFTGGGGQCLGTAALRRAARWSELLSAQGRSPSERTMNAEYERLEKLEAEGGSLEP